MKRFVLASGNKNKLIELRDMLSDIDVELVSRIDAGVLTDIEETGETFEENARLKAAGVAKAAGSPAIADDSGLITDALDGAPGVYSARYGGSHDKSDGFRCTLLLKNMENKQPRSARFVSCICCVFPNGDVIEARGECEGEILCAPRGDNGFGYDPVFLPAGFDRSMAELSPEEKNEISHRGKAVRGFKTMLKEYLSRAEVKNAAIYRDGVL